MNRLLGRRGAFLLIAGSAWTVYGIGMLASAHGTHFTALGPALAAVFASGWWGLVWITAGLTGVAAAFAGCPRRDAAGFIAVQAPPLLWLALDLTSWVESLVSPYGRDLAWVHAAVWAAALGAIYVVSGWPETHRED